MERYRIGIVIPAFNEAATIHNVVDSVCRYGLPIVVDDGSEDDTGDIAVSSGAKVVRHSVNQGYDRALDTGFLTASELGCEYVVTMDGDGQHEKGTLSSFIAALDEGADVVIGIRDHLQRLAEHIFAWTARYKWGIRDPLCGMKAYNMKVYHELGHFDSYNSIGTELAIFAAVNGKKIIQLPVQTRKRLDAPRFGNRFAANMKIMRALLRALF